METTETKNAVQSAAKETAESARKVGDKLRALAGSAADSLRRWAKRCGEALSGGARLATLQANQRVLQARMDRAYRELGRAVYAALGEGEQASALAESPEHQAALQQVKEAEANLDANLAKLAELRKSGGGENSTPS